VTGRDVVAAVSVITHFLAKTPYITACPKSVARFNSLNVLPVDLPVRPWPVAIVTLEPVFSLPTGATSPGRH
jgi:hypothetical protein